MKELEKLILYIRTYALLSMVNYKNEANEFERQAILRMMGNDINEWGEEGLGAVIKNCCKICDIPIKYLINGSRTKETVVAKQILAIIALHFGMGRELNMLRKYISGMDRASIYVVVEKEKWKYDQLFKEKLKDVMDSMGIDVLDFNLGSTKYSQKVIININDL